MSAYDPKRTLANQDTLAICDPQAKLRLERQISGRTREHNMLLSYSFEAIYGPAATR